MRPATPGFLRTRAQRRIAADPTSTALLLAGPTAIEMWPGVRRVGDAADRVLVEATIPDQRLPTAAAVLISPPRRTPTAYVTSFEWVGPSLPRTTGEVLLSYAGPGQTQAELTLDTTAPGALSDEAREALAAGFLANLAALAESRNRAA